MQDLNTDEKSLASAGHAREQTSPRCNVLFESSGAATLRDSSSSGSALSEERVYRSSTSYMSQAKDVHVLAGYVWGAQLF